MSRRVVWAALLAALLTASACAAPPKTSRNATNTAPSSAISTEQAASIDASAPGDVISVLLRDQRLSRLAMVMKGSGLTDVLAEPGPFTVFAPDDAAFAKLEPGLTELIQSQHLGWLSARMEYHVVRGSIAPAQLRGAKTLTSVTGQRITVTLEGTRTVLDGTAHVLESHEASTGWVYRIDAVLEPPPSQ